MRFAFIFVVLVSGQAWAVVTPPKEVSLGLQSARRVVRTELKRESRALSWSQFVVTKHKRAVAREEAPSSAN